MLSTDLARYGRKLYVAISTDTVGAGPSAAGGGGGAARLAVASAVVTVNAL
jgi:hypothetical protein